MGFYLVEESEDGNSVLSICRLDSCSHTHGKNVVVNVVIYIFPRNGSRWVRLGNCLSSIQNASVSFKNEPTPIPIFVVSDQIRLKEAHTATNIAFNSRVITLDTKALCYAYLAGYRNADEQLICAFVVRHC